MENKIEIHSDVDSKSILVSENQLKELIKNGYVAEIEENEYLFDGEKYWTIVSMIGNVVESHYNYEKIKKLNETGEWPSGLDLEYVENHPEDTDEFANWIRMLKDQMDRLFEMVWERGGLKIDLIDIKGFDAYQGPYAIIEIKGDTFTVHLLEYGELYIQNFPIINTEEDQVDGYVGDLESLCDVIVEYYTLIKKESIEIKKFENNDIKPLSDDILALQKDENGEYVKIEEPVEIEQIVDIIKDEEEIKKIEENITVDTSISVGEVKRGQIIYLTALLKRPNQSITFNQTTMGVLKCRIIDYYYGLNKLKQVIGDKHK